VGARARFTSNERVQPGSPGNVPLLDARAGGRAERFARRLGGHHPAGVFFAAILAGFAILGLIGIALGLLLIDVLLHTGGLARAAESAVTSAASAAVYVGLALLVTSRFPNRGVRLVAWAVAIFVPVFVAFARMYRGMHHPLDVAGGLLIGIGALLVLLFACRAAGVAHEARSPHRPRVATTRRAQPAA
jgi:hypothetical protein